MDREKKSVAVSASIIVVILFLFFVLAINSGCTTKYGPIRDISTYNQSIHTDYTEPVLYESFEHDVLGPIIKDY